MKKVSLIFCLIFTFLSVLAQKKIDIGVFSGGSYYLGDINPSQQFYSPSLSLGGFIRFNLNKRHSIRGNIFYGGIKGSDLDFNNNYQNLRGSSFKSSIVDLSFLFEFNFLPYKTAEEKKNYSTYLVSGLGYAFLVGSASSFPVLTLPFGVGFKLNLNKKLSTGIEWSFRKTFNDKIDGLENLSNTVYRSFIHNNDWFSFAGIFICYKIFRISEDCPAYYEWN